MSSEQLLPESVQEVFRKKSYGLFNHSAVQICLWNKKALRNEGVCYKQKFYGIDCHRCMQFTPVVAWCENNCIFCWRPMEHMKNQKLMLENADEPEKIVEELIAERKKLLSGFGGFENVNKEKLVESKEPNHYAISLSGEPTLYPKLPELVKLLKNKKGTKSIFIVSNGQEPEMLQLLIDEDALPTQMYLSVDAPNEKLFKEINMPNFKDGWGRLNKSLSLLTKMNCRTVIRYTLIKGLNDMDELLDEYADLFTKASPDFIEVKAYMFLGYSRKRLKEENMPFHADVKEFTEKLVKKLPYKIIDEDKQSRIFLLSKGSEGKGIDFGKSYI
ncbi:MAG: 4-demethylwyosine synthase TYW1 [Candidatus Diapherotrites archaeon]